MLTTGLADEVDVPTSCPFKQHTSNN